MSCCKSGRLLPLQDQIENDLNINDRSFKLSEEKDLQLMVIYPIIESSRPEVRACAIKWEK